MRAVLYKKNEMDRILIVDDDVELCGLVEEYLTAEGFGVECVHDGETGLQKAQSGSFLLIVLDVMLPGISGFDVLRRLRTKLRLPVLLLTARGEDVDRIVGLELGADDYLPKPFNPRELVARIRAILRRTSAEGLANAQAPPPEMLKVGDVELDPATRTVWQGGRTVELTSVEFNLLEALLREAGRVVTREQLVSAVLSRKFSPFDRSIDMHVSKVRKKLGDGTAKRNASRRCAGWATFLRARGSAAGTDHDEKSFPENLSVVLGGAGAVRGAGHGGGDRLPSADGKSALGVHPLKHGLAGGGSLRGRRKRGAECQAGCD